VVIFKRPLKKTFKALDTFRSPASPGLSSGSSLGFLEFPQGIYSNRPQSPLKSLFKAFRGL